MSVRIATIEPPYEPAVAVQLERMMPPGVAPIGLFRTFFANLEMSEAMHGWGTYELSRRLSVSVRAREIVIDRTCARCGCEYEWGVHVASFADRAGLTPEQIRSLTHGRDTDECWTGDAERVLIELVDQLHDRSDVDDDLLARLATAYRPAQLLDVAMLRGWYHAISFTARAARVDLEPWAPRFAQFAG